jgi:hypothetical protein
MKDYIISAIAVWLLRLLAFLAKLYEITERKAMRLNPGDKVRITQNAFDNIDVVNILVATKGSIGTVLSYEEYHDYYVNQPVWDDDQLSLVRDWIKDCAQYPIRFDTVVPPSASFLSFWQKHGKLFIECEVGKIEVLHVAFLKKIA